jgi:hypothetical protein
LRWLKEHNPFFSDLVIDSTFELNVTQFAAPKMEEDIKKEEPDTAQADEAGYSLLLHEHGLTEVEAPRREGNTYQLFKLVEMRGR